MRLLFNTKYLTLVALLLSVSCSAPKPAATDPQEALAFSKDQIWQLVSVKGKAVAVPNTITLILNQETGTLYGQSYCNRYFADFTAHLAEQSQEGCRYAMKISYLGSNDTRCPEADMEAEGRYLALLPKADACVLKPYTLTFYRSGKEILKYELQ